jgi:hypothetical protein
MASQQQNDSTSANKGGSANLGQKPDKQGQMPGQKQGPKAGQTRGQYDQKGSSDQGNGYEQTGSEPDRAGGNADD